MTPTCREIFGDFHTRHSAGAREVRGVYVICIGVVSVVNQYNCVYFCDT
jgi:hypothetical protein